MSVRWQDRLEIKVRAQPVKRIPCEGKTIKMPEPEESARKILDCYQSQLEWTAPERTIHQCREQFLSQQAGYTLADFTNGLKYLLEKRFLRRLNDERLELTPAGRDWLEEDRA